MHIALILDLFSLMLFLNDGKDFSLSLRKSYYLGLKVDFLAKCCQEDSPLGKQNKPTVNWRVASEILHPLTIVILFSYTYAHQSPKRGLLSVDLERVSKEGLTCKLEVKSLKV